MQASRLKEMKPSFFRMGSGRPEPNLTDKEWQEELAILKLYITPYNKNISKLGGKYSRGSIHGIPTQMGNITVLLIGSNIVHISIAFYQQFAAVSMTTVIINIRLWICSNSIMIL